MARFTWNPSFGAQSAREPRIRSARFGDGYEQRAASGLNADLATWSLTFENRSDADAASITAFLAARGGHEAFEWIAPGDTVTVTDHGFGVGDGTTTAFQLQATKNGEWSDVLGTWPVYTKPRTNSALYSEHLDNDWWQKFQCAALANVAVAPDGIGAADKITEDTTAASTHYCRRTIPMFAGTRYVVSVYAKAAERSQVWLRSGSGHGYFDLLSGTVLNTVGTGTTAGILSLGNGWFRLWVAWTGTATQPAYVGFGLMNGGTINYTGDGSSGALFWGAQFETGTTATPYIPTTTAAVTVNPSYWPASGDGFEPVTEPAPGVTIYLEDWQGKQQLYPTARTNLLTYSEQFDNAAWAKLGVGVGLAPVVTPDAGTAPDGSATADRVVLSCGGGATSSDRSIIRQSHTASATTKVRTIYLKSNTGATQSVWLHHGSAQSRVDVGTEWTRAAQVEVGGEGRIHFGLELKGDLGVPSADIMVWGAQREEGETPTPYIPTTTATVTRTDYTLGAKGAVTMGVAPASGAVLSWTGTGSWVKSWICRKWSRRVPNYGVATITADFEQVPA
jgi:phage-related protein